jgi:hypothetical protein
MTDRYRWICKQLAEDVFTNQEGFNTRDQQAKGRNRDLIPTFLRGTGNRSSGVP